jgi:hypothetical protein
MRWRVIDADVSLTVPVAVTFTDADTLAESIIRRRAID